MRRNPALLVLAALFTFPLYAFAQSSETITVERILVDARVTDPVGEPILRLKPGDFVVRVDGKPATVEAADWIPETAVTRELADVQRQESRPPDANASVIEEPAPQGRLLVFFFQTDFARNRVRIGGQMKILAYIDQMVESLEPEDRVAVLSYDSHLKFRLDFTNEKPKIREAMRGALLIDNPPPPQMVPMPRLGGRLNQEEMKKVSNPEAALIVLGNALRPIPGPKSLVLFGWGLGYLVNGHIVMGPDYFAAKRSLEGARVACFSLDITQADSHDLSTGLATASADTGGFYASTYNFPQLAMDRLQKTLSGHYELEVRKPDTKVVGVHTIAVDVKVKNAMVMARTTYVDK